MVRPDRVELPTFWFVGMQSDRILLILMPATTHFQANTWRTTAGIDERLMKGLSRDRLLQTNFSSDSLLHASGAGGPWQERRLHLEFLHMIAMAPRIQLSHSLTFCSGGNEARRN